jgi:glycosyltransferase involved in cell wall biosynthesis
MPAGPGSEVLRGGVGSLEYDAMRRYLRHTRAYLYTGTRPASYTLGLIEAAMTGVPVVVIGPGAFGCEGLLEPLGSDSGRRFDDPAEARRTLRNYLDNERDAQSASLFTRDLFIRTFGLQAVMAAWREFLA